MKRRLLIPLITAGAALGSGIASANSQYWRDHGLLLEVSADPRDGTDFVQTNPTHATRLELVAMNDAVRLRGMTIHFSDGRAFSQDMQTIRPGERVMVDLPANCGVIQQVDLDYGRQIVDRTPARLQIIPRDDGRPEYAQPSPQPWVRDHRRFDRSAEYGYQVQPAYSQPAYSQPAYSQPAYSQPAYSRPTYQRPASYVVQPAPQASTGWSGYIQGSFRF